MKDKPFKNARFATDEDIAKMSTGFTLPARLAKKAADWQKQQGQPLEQDLSQPDSEPRKDRPSTKQR